MNMDEINVDDVIAENIDDLVVHAISHGSIKHRGKIMWIRRKSKIKAGIVNWYHRRAKHRYQISSSFYEPSECKYAEDHWKNNLFDKRIGIKRVDMQELVNHPTIKGYVHESGIVGLTRELYEGNYLSTVRIPFRVASKIGMKAMQDRFLRMQAAVKSYGELREFDGMSTGFEGDIEHRVFIPFEGGGSYDDFISETMNLYQTTFFNMVMHMSFKFPNVNRTSLNDKYFAFGNLDHPDDPEGKSVEVQIQNMGVIARLWHDLKDKRDGVVIEILVPLNVNQKDPRLISRNLGHYFGVEVPEYTYENFESLDTVGSGRNISVFPRGDLVHRIVSTGEEPMMEMKAKVDEMGFIYNHL